MKTAGVQAFTLIELLVSIAIGMAVITTAFAGFNQVQKVTKRQSAVVALHGQAAAIRQALADDLHSLMGTAPLHLRAEAAQYPQPGRSVDLVEFTAMKTLHNRRLVALGAQRQAVTDAVWFRWRWDQGRKILARSQTPYEVVSNGHDGNAYCDVAGRQIGKYPDTILFNLLPQSRRDRRRDLDDNDGRWMPLFATADAAAKYRSWDDTQSGLSAKVHGGGAGSVASGTAPEAQAASTAFGVPMLPGDNDVLEQAMQPVAANVQDFRFGWVDRRNRAVVAGWADGTGGPKLRVLRYGVADATSDGSPATSYQGFAVDGAWLGGQVPTGAGTPISSMLGSTASLTGDYVTGSVSFTTPALTDVTEAGATPQNVRPALYRVAFTLSDTATGVSQEFSFSFPGGALLPPMPPATP